MDKMDLKKMWQLFLIDAGTNNKLIAEVVDSSPQVLGRKINSGTIKLLEFADILEKYGYQLKIEKKSKRKPRFSVGLFIGRKFLSLYSRKNGKC